VPHSSKTLLVLGATSDIGRATALIFAQAGWTIQLAGRDLAALRREADDIAARTGGSVTSFAFDVLQTEAFAAFIDALPILPDIVVCFVGLMGDQARAETNVDHSTTIMRSNYEGPALILGLFAERFVARGSGTIVGVSSVAGDRGRASNYVYGSAKAGFTAFLSGLRSRCAMSNVRIITIKPGFVRTRMTAGMRLPALLTVDARTAGEAIARAVNLPRDVVYVSRIWRFVMTIILLIPESIFKRLKI
jgi:decaprenylphospho-beta-D-erythro-pentofuranosid-2-ulose 2-reductase